MPLAHNSKVEVLSPRNAVARDTLAGVRGEMEQPDRSPALGPSANYRKNVAECVRLARLSRSVEQRNILFEMARTWKELADNAARLEKIETKNEKDDAA